MVGKYWGRGWDNRAVGWVVLYCSITSRWDNRVNGVLDITLYRGHIFVAFTGAMLFDRKGEYGGRSATSSLTMSASKFMESKPTCEMGAKGITPLLGFHRDFAASSASNVI